MGPFCYYPSSMMSNVSERDALQPQDQIVDHLQMENQVKEGGDREFSQKKTTLKKKKKKGRSKEYEYGYKTQKEDRNSFSNSFKIFLKFIRDLKQINPDLLQRIIDQNVPGYSVQAFTEEF